MRGNIRTISSRGGITGFRFFLMLIGFLFFELVPISLFAQQVGTQDGNDAAHKDCKGGYYNGPRPGRVRYTKDEYVWVVTTEFAKRFCMPEEFIDDGLKGASAIAYRIVYEPVAHCGWAGRKEICSRRAAHGMEIYYKSDWELPTVSETKFSYRALYMLDYSKHLLSTNGIAIRSKTTFEKWLEERPGAQNKFPLGSIILAGVKNSKVTWPISDFRQHIFVEEIMYGYNFISLEGTMGEFSNSRFEKIGMDSFVLAFNRRDDRSTMEGKSLSQLGHVIELPMQFFEKMRAFDRADQIKQDAVLKKSFPAYFEAIK